MRKELRQSIQKRARGLLYGGREDSWAGALASADAEHRCGAKCKQGGHKCPRRPVPGMKRCRVHGGLSTGARTAEGRERLRQNDRQRASVHRLRAQHEEMVKCVKTSDNPFNAARVSFSIPVQSSTGCPPSNAPTGSTLAAHAASRAATGVPSGLSRERSAATFTAEERRQGRKPRSGGRAKFQRHGRGVLPARGGPRPHGRPAYRGRLVFAKQVCSDPLHDIDYRTVLLTSFGSLHIRMMIVKKTLV
jgi:hypothetical protein